MHLVAFLAAAALSSLPCAGNTPLVLPSPASAAPVVPGAAVAAAIEPERVEIRTEDRLTLVGTFYAQPEPGAEPYVQPGARIASGQALCIIEAMKIMNMIDAEVSGVVKEICVQDAQPVEFGQVLFKVDTNG